MCRFKMVLINTKWLKEQVSIHPMCRFKHLKNFLLKEPFSFNTSYVSVQEEKEIEIEVILSAFQYILCVGSSLF